MENAGQKATTSISNRTQSAYCLQRESDRAKKHGHVQHTVEARKGGEVSQSMATKD